ncbi:MAG: hypothetical protein LIP05_13325 [Tannerellaceae bacterium]|nr:hypothetical protein [Tannerellaceae bacterium]
MKQIAICIVLLAGLLTGCNNSEKEARSRLEQARQMYEQNEFFAAKSEIDSLRALYPKEYNVLKDGLELMRQIELKECERTIAFCDSMIPAKEEECRELVKGFVLEKDSIYQPVGNYIWKQQTVERNLQRCYIRCGVNEKGEMSLASVYYGGRPIQHTSLKVSTPDGLFAETAVIPYDGGVNYRFEDLGSTMEVVTYKGDKGMDAVKFIYANEKERIKAEFTGGKPYTIYIAEGDKRAIAATYDLATVLSDIENMVTEREKTFQRKAYLQSKLELE